MPRRVPGGVACQQAMPLVERDELTVFQGDIHIERDTRGGFWVCHHRCTTHLTESLHVPHVISMVMCEEDADDLRTRSLLLPKVRLQQFLLLTVR